MNTNLPALGSGIGFRPPFRSDLLLEPSSVDFLEITMEHYLDVPVHKKRELELLLRNFTCIPHGLNLSLGSAEGIDNQYLSLVADFVQEVQPPWWSEHICFTHAGGVDMGHLVPLPFTYEALDVFCRNVEKVQKKIATPLILENITYTIEYPHHEMKEEVFLTKIHERTGCGFLLDVTNLFANSHNYGYDPLHYLESLPKNSVVQLHYVGGYWKDKLFIDSHSHATQEEIWQLMDEVCKRFSVKGILLERDEHIPEFAELKKEVEKARQIGKKNKCW